MKGVTKKLVAVVLCLWMLGSNVEAAEMDEQLVVYEDNEIYDDEEVYIEEDDGRIVLNFYAITDELDEYGDYSSPLANVCVNLYYRVDGQMQDVTQLTKFSDIYINLISNEEGKIIINNLPYGVYTYEIVSVPEGHRLQNKTEKFELSVFDTSIYRELFIKREIDLTHSPTINEETEPDIKEEIKPPIIDEEITNVPEENIPNDTSEIKEELIVAAPTEEIINKEEIIKIEIDNTSIKKENIEHLVEELYEEDDKVDKTTNQKVFQEATRRAKENNKNRMDMIKEAKTIAFNDQMKYALAHVDNSIQNFDKIASIPDKDDKNKKSRKFLFKDATMIKKYREYQNTILTRIPVINDQRRKVV